MNGPGGALIATILFIPLSAAQFNLEADWAEAGMQVIRRHCPICAQDSIVGHGRRRKQAHDQRHDWIGIRRGLCSRCGKTFTFLPPFSPPYGHYSFIARSQALQSRFLEGRSWEAAAPTVKDPDRVAEPPDEKRLTEASGNEGATYERSYHRAALVLWRRNRTLDVLLQAGVVAAMPYLRQLATGGKRARPEAIAVAERILEAWPGDAQRRDSCWIGRELPGSADRIEMITALTKLNVPTLIERFIRATVASSYDGSENAALVASVSLLGETQAAAVLSNLVLARMPECPNECMELLLALSENPSLCFPEVAEAAVAALDSIGTRDAKPEISDWEPEEPQRARGPQFLENLLRALQRFKGGTLCGAAAEKIALRPEAFSPVTLVVPAIERIRVGYRQKTTAVDSSVRHLWTSAAEFLLRCSEVRPEPPSDWCLNVEISCSCPDCRELQAFARDPAERVHRFRVRKERRRQLHATIDRHRLDMTHVTERVGSPQTLVCTKDRRTFDQRMKQYRDEVAAMRRLVRLAPKSGGAALSRRMEVAVERAADLKQREAPAKK